MFKWGFRANVEVHQGSEEVPIKNGHITFNKFVRSLDVLKPTKLWLNPLLFNGTLQTLYYSSHESKDKFQVYYGREIFTYEDGGVASLDWVIPPPKERGEYRKLYEQTLPEGWPRLTDRTRFFTEEERQAKQTGDNSSVPIYVILHGLGGGSHEPLIRNVAETIANEGWETVVINSRGCCRTKITSGKLFNAFSTDDVKEVLVELRKRFPNRPIYTIGFSFGACILANLLGSNDADIPKLVKAAALVGCPWDLYDSAHHIEKSWSGSYLFNPALVLFLTRIIKNNYTELHKDHPELVNEKSLADAKKFKKTYQFDGAFTCKFAGYDDVFDYYRDGSPLRRALNINVPTLAINATDDPAVSNNLPVEEAEKNPFLALVKTDLGGHLGFVQWLGEFWCAEVAHQFFTQFEAAAPAAAPAALT